MLLNRRRYCVFYSEDGGFQSTDENNNLTQQLYFMGVIDILTPYNIVKKTEHFWKSITQDKVSLTASSLILKVIATVIIQLFLTLEKHSAFDFSRQSY